MDTKPRKNSEYIKNPYKSTIKREITQFKNEERIRIDISPKANI